MSPTNFLKKIRAQEPAKEFNFALEIIGQWLKGAVWTVEEGRIIVTAFAPPVHWDSEQELTQKVNESYSQAVARANLSSDQEPKKVIFGLPYDWVEGERIVGTKLELLRVVCQRMKIKPVGFVVTTEAIVKYLKAVQGTAPSAIIVWLDKKQLEVVLLRSGQVVGRPVVQRSAHLGDDIAEGLARIELPADQILPARVLLYGIEEDFEEASQQVVDFPWLEESFQFLHLPKVETMPTEFDIQAVALAGGAEVVSAQGETVEMGIAEDELHRQQTEIMETKDEVDGSAKNQPAQPKDAAEEIDETEAVSSQDQEETIGEEVGKIEPPLGNNAFGFTKQDVVEENVSTEAPPAEISPEPSIQSVSSPSLSPEPEGSVLKQRRFHFPEIHLKGRFFRSKKRAVILAGVGLGLLLIAGGAFAVWWYAPTAQITLFVEPYLIEQMYQIVLDPTVDQVQAEELIFPAREVTTVLRDEQSHATSGTKVIGDKAQGQVTMYNRTATEKELEAGTILTGPGELQFSLDEAVVIASESAGEDYTRIPGKAVATVTAVQIGSESNLAGGTEFEVGKYSKTDVVAKSDSDFAGGSSQEIRVVSQEDIDAAKEELVSRLEGEAASALEALLEPDQVLVAESINSDVTTEQYQPELGAEAESMTATIEVEYAGLVYRRAEFDAFIQEKLASSVPQGYEYQDERKEVDFKLEEVKDNQAIFQVKVWANLMPVVPVDQIKEDIRGKTITMASFYLGNLSGVTRYSTPVVNPQFIPEKIKRLPRKTDRITIDVQPE